MRGRRNNGKLNCLLLLPRVRAARAARLLFPTHTIKSLFSKGPAKRIQHVDATPSNIVESNMLHSFGHHVARCCMMLDDVERSLNSIKHRLQHHPTFLLFSGVNKNVAFVWPPCSTLLNARMPTKLTCGYLYPRQLSTVYSCFGVAAWF